MYAVCVKRPKVVKELLLAGADPTAKDKVGTDSDVHECTCSRYERHCVITHIVW